MLDKVREGLSNPDFVSTEKYASQQQICFKFIASNCELSGKSFKNYVEIKSFSSGNKREKSIF